MILYTALSSLISIYTQRAIVARLENYGDTALRERIQASSLCQRLGTLITPELLQPLLRDALAGHV